jgi:hypothetical protein
MGTHGCAQPPVSVPLKGAQLFVDVHRSASLMAKPLKFPDGFPTNTIPVGACAVICDL